MAAESIKEFVVKLGFQTDEAALRKFTNGIQEAEKAVRTLALSVTGLALGVVAGVQKFASGLEQLYFSSQRTGSSVAALKAWGVAAEDFGVSADTARGAVEGLAQAYFANPFGTGGLFKVITGKDIDPKDFLKDVQQLLQAFAKLNAQGRGYMAAQWGQMLGMPELLTRTFAQHPEMLTKFFELLKQMGPNAARGAQDAHRLEESWRSLQLTLEGLAITIVDVFERHFHTSLDSLNNWLQVHGPELAKEVADMAGRMLDWIERVWKAIDRWIAKFDQWDQRTGGWLGTLAKITAAVTLLGGGGIVGGVLNMGAALVGLVAKNPELVALGVAIAAIVKGLDALSGSHPNNVISRIGRAPPASEKHPGYYQFGSASYPKVDAVIDPIFNAIRDWFLGSGPQYAPGYQAPATPSIADKVGNWWTNNFGTGAFERMYSSMSGTGPLGPAAAGGMTVTNSYGPQTISIVIQGANQSPEAIADAVKKQLQNTGGAGNVRYALPGAL